MQKMTLKMLRVANGLNQKQAAELVGVSTDTWGHWEAAKQNQLSAWLTTLPINSI